MAAGRMISVMSLSSAPAVNAAGSGPVGSGASTIITSS
jgi:hypothetical protein